MSSKITITVVSTLILLVSGAAFGQIQVPNTFQSGQPARAAEVNDNFSTLESAANQNASDIAGLEARVSALEIQSQILFDNLSPPARVIEDATGTVVTPDPGQLHFWSIGGHDFDLGVSIPNPDPLNPRQDLPVEILQTIQNMNALASCSVTGPESSVAWVLDVVQIIPGTATNFSTNGGVFKGIFSSSGEFDARSPVFIDSFIIDFSSRTIFQSFAPDVGDTGLDSFNIDLPFPGAAFECPSSGTLVMNGNLNVARFDLYTAPIISIGGLLFPPFTAVVP